MWLEIALLPSNFTRACYTHSDDERRAVIVKARKYRESYRIVDGGAGTGRRDAVYAGEYFGYPAGSHPIRRRALATAPWAALYWLATLLYLRTAGATGRCIYALVPMMVGLLPGAYALMGLATMLRAPERLTVVQRENGPGRLTRAALGCGVSSAVGCVGCAAFVTINGLWAQAWHEPLLAAAASAAAWLAFARARRDYRALGRVA